MSVSDWAGLILTALSIVAITVGGIRWFIQAEMKALSTELKNDLSELKPNGGSSIKDQVNRLEDKSHKLEEKIDNLYNVLINEGVKTNKNKKSENNEL
jgi:chaperonin cofactor prefoldin